MNKRFVGAEKEEEAAAWLQSQGYEILEKNYRVSTGEIDIIAKERYFLVFVEVKYRSSDVAGTGAEAVGFRKQQRIYRTAQYYMKQHHIAESQPCRFDVVSIDGDNKIELIPNAFGGM
ncbi:MAG: YraN family protein [Lachnospiraceae bacterium]